MSARATRWSGPPWIDLAFVESARWHEGRLWFAHWSVGEIIATDLDGHSDVMAPGRAALGWSIDWLPDARLLVTGESLLRQEPDGRGAVSGPRRVVA
jgi:hypothetical protein